jgi:hypothetical protein
VEAMGELHRRKLFAGIAMIAAPLLVAIAYLIGPSLQRDSAAQMAALADAPGRMNAALIVGLIGLVLFVYAALGLAHLLREERSWMGQIGGLLAVTGLVFIGVMQGAYIAATEAAQLDVAAAAATFDNVMGNPVMILAIAGSVAVAVGFVVLAIGLLLARTAPMWSAVLLGVGSIVQWFGISFASTPLTILGFGLVFVGLAPLGYGLIAEPDEAWEHPVHFEGFRPTAAH